MTDEAVGNGRAENVDSPVYNQMSAFIGQK